MRTKTAKKLLKKVSKDYDEISEEFDKTRQYNWKEFLDFLDYIKDGEKIIDLGCGNGRFHRFLEKNKDVDYVGIDISEKLLEKARKQAKEKKWKGEFIKADLLELPIKNKSFDIAVAIASIHHIPSKKLRNKAIKEFHRVLKNSGILIITAWNLFQKKYKKFIWKSRLRHLLSFGKYDARDTFIPWGKTGVKRYYYAFKEKELAKILKNNGFKIIKTKAGNNFIFICKKETQ